MDSMVTTKQGDRGQTRALDGEQFPKDHPMMEAVGALDTLRCHLALTRTLMQERRPEDLNNLGFLLYLLHTCFLIGSAISDPHNRKPEWRRGTLTDAHLKRLETEQAQIEAELRLPRAFIVCAANPLAAQIDITASVARRFERKLVAFQRVTPGFDDAVYLAFANRLSDYLFVLARHFEDGRHHPVNYELLEGEISPK